MGSLVIRFDRFLKSVKSDNYYANDERMFVPWVLSGLLSEKDFCDLKIQMRILFTLNFGLEGDYGFRYQ